MTKYITAYFISLITILAFVLGYRQLSQEKLKISLKFHLFLIIGTAISIVLLYLNNAIIKNIFTIIFMTILFKILSNKKIYETFYYSVLIWIYGIIVDLINMLIATATGLIEMLDLLLVQSILTIIIAVLVYTFCSLPPIKKFSKKTINKLINLKPYFLIDFAVILLLVYISMLCFSNLGSISNISFYIMIAIIIIIVLYNILDKYYNIKKLKAINSMLLKNNEFFVKLEEQNRIFKHNINNRLLGIKSVSPEKIKKLIEELISENNNNYIAPKEIKNIPEGLSGIIYEKFYVFNNSKINLAIDNNIKSQLIDNLKPKTFNELCEAVGVFIDNALEATSKSDEKVILINFNEDDNFYYININNTFKNILDIDEFGNKNYSTKKGIRGIGVFSILKRKEIKLKTKVINGCFMIDIKAKKYLYN